MIIILELALRLSFFRHLGCVFILYMSGVIYSLLRREKIFKAILFLASEFLPEIFRQEITKEIFSQIWFLGDF